MSVKQIRWHVAVLAVTVIAVLAVLFALTTVTSSAAEASYDPQTRTYTLSDSTYDQQIKLDSGTTTTLAISGYNKLTYGDGTYQNPCITGTGDLTITGTGTLEVSNGEISCYDFKVGDGVTLKISDSVFIYGSARVGKAAIEPCSPNAYLDCRGYYTDESPRYVFNNSTLKIGMYMYGEAVLNDCNVTIENSSIYTSGAPVTINGGTYNLTNDEEHSYAPLVLGHKTVVNNAVIKSDMDCMIQNLEMTNSTLEITTPSYASGAISSRLASLSGDNLIFVNSKVKIDGYALDGISANQQLILTGNTEVDIKALETGIIGSTVEITHSGGKIQATDPDRAIAAVAAVNNGFSSYSTPGKLTLTGTYLKEPAGGTVDIKIVRPSSVPQDNAVPITTILDGDAAAKTVVLEVEHKTHTWDAGKVTQEPTETAEGVKTYTCTVCGATKTEVIPKLTPQGSQDSQGSQGSQTSGKGEDGTPFGKGASVSAAEAAVLALPNDNDPAGTAFGLLQLKATKVTKNSINLKWKAVPGASKYILFANKCGTGNKYKKLGEVTGTSYTATQAAGAAIQKGTYYKFMMIAADASGKVVSTSKTVHAATKGGKIGNHKKVTVKKSVTKKAKKLKKGKTLKLKAKAVPQAKKLKVKKHRAIMYETSNPAVAQVNSKGAVKGVGKGTCYIYAYAQNGTCAKVKVTVK